jgi:hypothetical protein
MSGAGGASLRAIGFTASPEKIFFDRGGAIQNARLTNPAVPHEQDIFRSRPRPTERAAEETAEKRLATRRRYHTKRTPHESNTTLEGYLAIAAPP